MATPLPLLRDPRLDPQPGDEARLDGGARLGARVLERRGPVVRLLMPRRAGPTSIGWAPVADWTASTRCALVVPATRAA